MRARRGDEPAPEGLRVRRGSLGGSAVVVLSWPIDAPATERLSRAEREIFEAVLAGMSYAAIAAERGAALGTVKKQIGAVYRKLGVGSRAELASRFGAAPRS